MIEASNRILELTPLQQGMVFHHLLEGRHSGTDVEQIVGELREPIRREPFMDAWRRVIARHDILRSSIVWEGRDQPTSRIHREVRLPLREEDLRSSSRATREAHFREIRLADRRRGFDLSEPPLMRLGLFRLDDERWRLLWTIHHILGDGRTFALLLRDVFDVYEASLRGSSVEPRERPPFERYVEWIHTHDPERSRTFWEELLRGVEAPTPLPAARAEEGDAGADEGERGFLATRLDASTVQRLREVAGDQGATLNTLFQAAWALVLSRFTGESDITFGAIRGGRRGTVPGADQMIGLFIHSVPVRVDLGAEADLPALLRTLRRMWVQMREHEHVPLARIQDWSGVPAGTPLFHSLVNFQDPPWTELLRRRGGAWTQRRFDIHNQLIFPLMVRGHAGDDLRIRMEFDPARLDEATVKRMLRGMAFLLEDFARDGRRRLGAYSALPPKERERSVHQWNDTERPPPRTTTVHGQIADQAALSPEADALIFQGRRWTYARLMAEAGRIARLLGERGVGRGQLVGIFMERSPEMVAALIGTLEAGAAYVPIDPHYPPERARIVMEDAGLAVVLSDPGLLPRLPARGIPVLVVGEDSRSVPARNGNGKGPTTEDPGAAGRDRLRPGGEATASDLAYVIYTSGSTGRPKGVMVEHGNVVNFFVGMDERMGGERPGTWLAVTSISFDIAVLELLWTLSRGFRVVIHPDRVRAAEAPGGERTEVEPGDGVAPTSADQPNRGTTPPRPMDFGLFYFSTDSGTGPGATGRDRYRLLLEGARFADEHGLGAVWTPERHFHSFGGIYPNPSVTAAALAATTRRVKLRAGSIVLPLHDPIRVAEEWSVVDNLSDGRVALSFASGWHDRDFVFAPDRYEDRREGMFRQIETVRALWRGDAVRRTGPRGEVEVRIHPTPVQPELPFFVTAGGSPDTFRRAGEVGGHVLTHLLGQSPAGLGEKIEIYRKAWRAAGHPGDGHVALMLHTFLGNDDEEVKQTVRDPFRRYLRSSVGLISELAAERGHDLRSADLDQADMEALLDHAFERYFETSALMGTPERCLEVVTRLSALGVDELACLIDFGVDEEEVLASLELVPELMRRANGGSATRPVLVPEPASGSAARAPALPGSVGEAIRRWGVTHLQCTPSMLRLLLAEEETRRELCHLDLLCVGGEAFPPLLADELLEVMDGEVLNMYGPTETTVWSSTHRVVAADKDAGAVPLGRPIANTGLYVLDASGAPLPVGVPGELWIGGRGVARGYLNRPALTRERFVDSPLPDVAGRLYRTGDRVRRREDGNLEFLGRADHQVKLRGHRIELGEIESALNAHPSIRESVVVLRGEGPGDERLVAYLLPAGAEPAPDALRKVLSEKLPEVMIPSDFVSLDAFPLTPNAKIDRARLPAPAGVQAEPEAGAEAAAVRRAPPDTEMEATVTRIWEEVLQRSGLGPDENFFDLGGHSLLTITVHRRLTEVVGPRLALRDLFRYTTIRSLARHLAGKVDDPSQGPAMEVVRKRAEARRAAIARQADRRSEVS